MNVEATALWVRARQALATARLLADQDPDASVSRSYYAAFHAVTAVLAEQGTVFRKHQAVEAAVHRDFVRTGMWPQESGRGLFTAASVAQHRRLRRGCPTLAIVGEKRGK